MEYTSTEKRNARLQDLVALLLSVPRDNFDPFDIYRSTYDSAGHSIGVDILIPRANPSCNPRPVLVRIHGGFLVTGSSLFPAWFSKWVLDWAEAQSAIIISPDYRLLPEVKGVDILRDIEAFWKWFHSDGPSRHLASVGRHDITLNKNQLLLLGESAGGYLAIQSILSGFARPTALVVLYPMIDMKADHYTKEYSKPIVGVPNFPHKTIDDFLETLSTRTAISEADPPERLDLALASVQTGRFLELLGDEPELFILDRIRGGKFASKSENQPVFPSFFLLHGDQDSAVPAEGSRRFLEILDKVDPAAKYRVAYQPGDHGFDAQATLEDEWLREGLDWVLSQWLVDTSKL
ncbi:Alpha/Beta hydrolase protein [Xylaria arbuscula]|nr:Alpha/Beta hydrolase protein [Xylaria arbuscula]